MQLKTSVLQWLQKSPVIHKELVKCHNCKLVIAVHQIKTQKLKSFLIIITTGPKLFVFFETDCNVHLDVPHLGLSLTCMFICELDETVRDISPSVETNHLGLNIPTCGLKERKKEKKIHPRLGEDVATTPWNFPREPAPLCTHQNRLTVTKNYEKMIDFLSKHIIRLKYWVY